MAEAVELREKSRGGREGRCRRRRRGAALHVVEPPALRADFRDAHHGPREAAPHRRRGERRAERQRALAPRRDRIGDARRIRMERRYRQALDECAGADPRAGVSLEPRRGDARGRTWPRAAPRRCAAGRELNTISSPWTWAIRKGTPLLIFVGLPSLLFLEKDEGFPRTGYVLMAILFVVTLVFWRLFIATLADEVEDHGDRLLVRRGAEQETVLLADIMHVTESIGSESQRIILKLV